MSYKIVLEKKVIKSIDHLPNDTIQIIYDTVSKLRENPRPNKVEKLKHLRGYRIRVGRYRILYTIDDDDRLVSVYRVSHRKDSY